jgi:hypothetical protein
MVPRTRGRLAPAGHFAARWRPIGRSSRLHQPVSACAEPCYFAETRSRTVEPPGTDAASAPAEPPPVTAPVHTLRTA